MPSVVRLEQGNTSTYCLFYFTSSSSPLFSIKKQIKLNWIKTKPSFQILSRWFFETLVHHLFSLLAFQINTLFLAPVPPLDLLACHVVSSRSLDLVTFFLQTCLRWPYCELCPKGYSLPAKVHRDKIQSRHT